MSFLVYQANKWIRMPKHTMIPEPYNSVAHSNALATRTWYKNSGWPVRSVIEDYNTIRQKLIKNRRALYGRGWLRDLLQSRRRILKPCHFLGLAVVKNNFYKVQKDMLYICIRETLIFYSNDTCYYYFFLKKIIIHSLKQKLVKKLN